MSKKKFNPEVDLIKFFFSVIIILYHSKYIDVVAAEQQIFPYGYTAVEFFFLVSGYLMAKSSLKYDITKPGRSAIDFVIRKLKSIYPYFLFSFISAFVARQIIFFVKTDHTIIDFCKDAVLASSEALMLMKSGVEFGTIYNGPTWYIGAMLFAMAILFPLLLKHRDWYLNIGSLVIAIFGYALSYQEKGTLNYLDWSGWTTMSIIRAIAGVSLGCFVFSLVERVQSNGVALKKAGKVLLWGVELSAIALFVIIMQFEGKNSFDYITVILSLLICFIIFSGLTGVPDILPQKICSFLGKCSLLIYLNHRYMTRIINHFIPDLTAEQALLTYFALTIAWSVVSEIVVTLYKKLCEKALPKLKNAIFQ